MNARRTPYEIIGNRRIRAVALDVDGTIVNKNEETSCEIVDIIHRMLTAEIHIIICTARSIESTLKLLGKYFSEEEMTLFGYINLGGSHAYHVLRKGNSLVPKKIYAHSYNPAQINREQAVRDFLEKQPRVIEKATSLLIDVDDAVRAKRYVRTLCRILGSSPLKAYQCHDKVCISLRRFDKDKGLREYLKFKSIPSYSTVRIADQGAPFEADYEFLHNQLGFSVGTRDASNKNGCHRVFSSARRRILSLSATITVLQATLAFAKPTKKLVIKPTKKYGNGVFAGWDIKNREVIHILSGEKMNPAEMARRVNSKREYIDDPFQIGRRTYIDLDKLSRTFNHSCDPNGGIRKTSELFALRDIKKGEEITYDYSTTIAPTRWHMKCRCGSKNCRKVLGDVLSIPKAQLNKYKKLGALQKYMKPLLKEVESGHYIMPKYEILLLKRLENK